jgi:hypothetical protein
VAELKADGRSALAWFDRGGMATLTLRGRAEVVGALLSRRRLGSRPGADPLPALEPRDLEPPAQAGQRSCHVEAGDPLLRVRARRGRARPPSYSAQELPCPASPSSSATSPP